MNLKIREAQLQKVPYMLVVGDREAQDGTVSVRNRKHADQGAQKVDEFVARIQHLIDTKARTRSAASGPVPQPRNTKLYL